MPRGVTGHDLAMGGGFPQRVPAGGLLTDWAHRSTPSTRTRVGGPTGQLEREPLGRDGYGSAYVRTLLVLLLLLLERSGEAPEVAAPHAAGTLHTST